MIVTISLRLYILFCGISSEITLDRKFLSGKAFKFWFLLLNKWVDGEVFGKQFIDLHDRR